MSDPFGFDDLSLEWLASKPGVKWRKHAPALAAWVADMDFPPAPVVLDALRDVLDRGDLGYPMWPTYKSTSLPEVFAARMAERTDPERFKWLLEMAQKQVSSHFAVYQQLAGVTIPA